MDHSSGRRAAYHLQQHCKLRPAGLDDVFFRLCRVGGLKIALLRQLVDERKGPMGLQFLDLIIIHVGGNELVKLQRRAVMKALLDEFAKLGKAFPEAAITWLHMIPHCRWGTNVRSSVLDVSDASTLKWQSWAWGRDGCGTCRTC